MPVMALFPVKFSLNIMLILTNNNPEKTKAKAGIQNLPWQHNILNVLVFNCFWDFKHF